MPQRILLAIPAFQCGPQLKRVLHALSLRPELMSKIETVIVFDNRSPDTTSACALQQIHDDNLAEWVRVVQNENNYGLGGTQKLAFRWAIDHHYSHIIVLHGDDQASVEDIDAILRGFDADYDAVLGSRFAKGAKRRGYAIERVLGNSVLNLIFTLVTRRQISDLGSGLNGFRLKTYEDRHFNRFSNQFNFNVDLLLDLVSKNMKFIFVPITWREIDQVSNARNVRVALSMMRSLFQWKFAQPRAHSEEQSLTFRILNNE